MKRILLLIGFVSVINIVFAQQDIVNLNGQKIEPAHPHDIKVLSEYKDKAGNTIRTIRYAQGVILVTQTIIIPKRHFMYVHVPINPDTIKKELVTIQVSKSQYYVAVYYRKKMIRVYKAVFGPQPMKNKCMEGDRCTPEGWYKIANKNPKSQYNKFLGLDYPNDSTMARFNQLKKEGTIPASAKVGGAVGIHGIWKNGDDMIELGVGWTDGCIAIKNKDIDDLYELVAVGTKVQIIK